MASEPLPVSCTDAGDGGGGIGAAGVDVALRGAQIAVASIRTTSMLPPTWSRREQEKWRS